MNKGLLVLCMIITAVAALGVVFIMILGLNGYSVLSFAPGMDFQIGSGNTVLLKDESISMDEIKRFTLDTSAYAISVKAVPGNTAHIRQYGDQNMPSNEYMSVDKNGADILISTGSRSVVNIGFFMWFDRRIEIDIPQEWLGSVSISTSSGGVTLLDDLHWSDVTLRSSSGGIKINNSLTADSLELRSSSGGIRCYGEVIVAGKVYANATSGGIKTEGRISARSIELGSSSGGIRLGSTVSATDSFSADVTSGGITCAAVLTDTFDIRTTSGTVNFSELNGRGNLKCSSGGIKIETLLPNGDISIRSSSGGVKIGLPSDLSFKLDASASSGSIKSDFPLSFSDDRGKKAFATIGDEPSPKIDIGVSSGGITVIKK